LSLPSVPSSAISGAAQIHVQAFGASLPRATAVRIGEVVVWFNREFRKESYSVPLRPDITLELPGGHLHLFDAKLKHDPGSWTTGADSDEGDSDTEVLTYRRGDLYKMHTYRDALSASVWILSRQNMPIKRYSPTPRVSSPQASGRRRRH
jgi:hypothetical protein